VRRLVRVDTDDHCHEYLRGLNCCWDPRGHSCFRSSSARSSFEPPAARTPTGRASFDSQPINDQRQALREPPRQRPRDATDQPQRLPPVSSRHIWDALAWVPPRRVMGRAFWSDPRIFDEYRSPVRARLHADVPGRAMSPAKAQIVGHGRATHRPDVSSARACVMRSHASSPAAW
jgi:hypothetical protein